MKEKNVKPSIMIDCSHGNSLKNHKNQASVLMETLKNISITGSIIGVMIESNINSGKQKLVSKKKLKYGISITDACIDLQETSNLLLYSYEALTTSLTKRKRVPLLNN